jgi:hypothetical protein
VDDATAHVQAEVLQTRMLFEDPDRLTDARHWHEHIPFAFFLVEFLAPRRIVELGTWKGDSYGAFCQAVATLGSDTQAIAVDTWEGDVHTGRYGPEVFDELRDYHDPRYGTFSELVRLTFDEALAGVPEGTVDLLHLDGTHAYEMVRHDVEAWLPKLSDRGVLLLHDTNVRERGFGVWRIWSEIASSSPSFAFGHGFGLGVLHPTGRVPRIVRLLAALADETAGLERLFRTLGSRIELLAESSRLSRALATTEAHLEASQEDAELLVAATQRGEALARHAHELATRAGELRVAVEASRKAQVHAEEELGRLRSGVPLAGDEAVEPTDGVQDRVAGGS